MVTDVFKEVYRVTIPGGRFCLNVADIHTKYYYPDARFSRIPLAHMVLERALSDEVGFRLFETYIWNKFFHRRMGGRYGPLFGSSPYPPTIYSSVSWDFIFILRKPGERMKVPRKIKEASKIDVNLLKKYTSEFWRIPPDTRWVKDHPSVFPLEIPKRCITLYSFVGDMVLDPFLGSASTMIAPMNSRGTQPDTKWIRITWTLSNAE